MSKFYQLLSILILIICISASNTLAQNVNGSIDVDGVNRTFIAHFPPGFDANTQSLPLVLCFHGLGDTPNGIMGGTGFNNAADTSNFVVVYPAAIDNLFGALAWNNGTNPFGSANDVGFTSQLIDYMYDEYNIDLDRVYATGFSMGGIMSHRLGCELNDRIAAIAPVAGVMATTILPDCSPGRAVPVMHIHGTGDSTVPYDGQPLLSLSSVDETIDFWVANNNCDSEPSIVDLPDTAADGYTIQQTTYACEENTEVRLYTITDYPHLWPQPSNDISATVEIWRFFNAHVLPEAQDTTTVGIATADFSEQHQLKYYPNPTNGFLQVNWKNTAENTVQQLQIFNVLGQLVGQQAVPNAPQVQLNVDCTHLNNGMYWVQLIGAQASTSFAITKK